VTVTEEKTHSSDTIDSLLRETLDDYKHWLLAHQEIEKEMVEELKKKRAAIASFQARVADLEAELVRRGADRFWSDKHKA
jgi:protease II